MPSEAQWLITWLQFRALFPPPVSTAIAGYVADCHVLGIVGWGAQRRITISYRTATLLEICTSLDDAYHERVDAALGDTVDDAYLE